MATKPHFWITLSYITDTYLASILCLACIFFPACLPPLKKPYCLFRNYGSVSSATVITFASGYFDWSPSVTVKRFSLDFGFVCSALKKKNKIKINDDFSAIFSFQMECIFVQTDHFCFIHEGLGQSLNDT